MRKAVIPFLGAAALVAVAPAQSFFDDFNRPDAPNLGVDWNNFVGSPGIFSNMAGGTSGNNSALVAGRTGAYTDTTLKVDAILNGTAVQFVALLLGHNGVATTGNGLFVKVQQNGVGSLFNTVGFYTGSNASNATAIQGGATFFTITPFTNARLSLYCPNATTVTLDIDSDFNGTPDQSYSRTINLGGITLGNQFGVGFFNAGRGDNFEARVVPEPGTLAVLGLGALALLRRRKKA